MESVFIKYVVGKRIHAVPLYAVILFVCAGCQVRPGIPFQERVLYEKDSLYNRILVTEDQDVRYLRFGYGYIQSAMRLQQPSTLQIPYTAYLMMGLSFVNPRRGLMIGLAGGAMVRFLRATRPDMELDVVEIDPAVVEVAERYFGIKKERNLKIHVEDGRVFTKRVTKKYDWIILDAFHSDTVPHHMTTVEFFQELSDILSHEGVVTVNIAPLGPGILHMALIRTFATAFSQVYIFQVPNRGNIVAVGSNGSKRLAGREIKGSLQDLKSEVGGALFLLDPAEPFLNWNPTVTGAPLLTDDYAPVDALRYFLATGVELR